MHLSILLAATVCVYLPAQAASVCYGQHGNQDPTLAVCDPSTEVSSCCAFGDYCYSNGLCQLPGVTRTNATVLTIYRVRGCTDANATTGECLPFEKCIGKGNGVTACKTNSYCCYGLDGCDCSNSTQTFTLPAGTIITSLPVQAATSTSSAASSSTSPAVTAHTSTSNAASSSNNSVAIGAGVGVGVGVALLIAAGVGSWLWRRRRRGAAAASTARNENGHGDSVETKYGGPESSVPAHSSAELTAVHRSEMDAIRPVAQLDDTSRFKPSHQHAPAELA